MPDEDFDLQSILGSTPRRGNTVNSIAFAKSGFFSSGSACARSKGHVPMRVEAENVQEIMVEQKAHTQFVFCFLCGQVSPRLLLRLHQMLFRLFPLVYPLQMRNPLQKKLLLKRQPRTQKKRLNRPRRMRWLRMMIMPHWAWAVTMTRMVMMRT